MYLGCPSYDKCEYDIYSNFFINNTASIDGGAIKWVDNWPSNLTSNIYDKNSAIYGNDIASYAKTLQRVDNSRNLQGNDNIISNIPSG